MYKIRRCPPSIVFCIEQKVGADNCHADGDDGKDDKDQKHEAIDIVDLVCPEWREDEVPEKKGDGDFLIYDRYSAFHLQQP